MSNWVQQDMDARYRVGDRVFKWPSSKGTVLEVKPDADIHEHSVLVRWDPTKYSEGRDEWEYPNLIHSARGDQLKMAGWGDKQNPNENVLVTVEGDNTWQKGDRIIYTNPSGKELRGTITRVWPDRTADISWDWPLEPARLGVQYLRKVAMAERSGDPELDALIEQFMDKNWGYLEDYVNPDIARGNCADVSEFFAKWMRDYGIDAEIHDITDDAVPPYDPASTFESAGYGDAQMRDPEGGWHTTVEIKVPSGTYMVDFTASQFGYTEFPMVQRLDDNGWQRKWASGSWEDWQITKLGPEDMYDSVAFIYDGSKDKLMVSDPGGEHADIEYEYNIESKVLLTYGRMYPGAYIRHNSPENPEHGVDVYNGDYPFEAGQKALLWLKQHYGTEKVAAWGEVNRPDTPLAVGDAVVFYDDRDREIRGVIRKVYPDEGESFGLECMVRWDTGPEAGTSSVIALEWLKRQEDRQLDINETATNEEQFRLAGWTDTPPEAQQPTLVRPQSVWWVMEDGSVLIEGLNTNYTHNNPPNTDDYRGHGYIDQNGEPVIMSYSYTGNYWDPGYAALGPQAKNNILNEIKKTIGMGKTASPITSYQWIPLTSFELKGWEELTQRERQSWINRAIRHNDRARKFNAKGGATGRELWALATKRFENKCAYCSKFLAWGTLDATLDHIHSLTLGGSSTIDNLVPACKSCNQELAKWDERNNPQRQEDYAVPHPEFGGPYIQKKDERVTYEPRSGDSLLV